MTLEGYPLTALRRTIAPFDFDRKQKFGYKDRLDYQVVINLAVAQHRSQGSFQTLMNAWNKESFRLYDLPARDAEARSRALFSRLAEDQFAKLQYDDLGRKL